jgi:hypothetical protein
VKTGVRSSSQRPSKLREKENPRTLYAVRSRPQPAPLVRASSRRIMTMKAGSAPILEYQSDQSSASLARLLAARSHSEEKKKVRNKT